MAAPPDDLDRSNLPLIQGEIPNSVNEYFFASALETLKVEFDFHVQISGGRGVRGGQEIDFLVRTPFPTAIQIFGRYWHGGQKTDLDRLKEAQIRGLGYEYYEYWDWETDTYEECLALGRRL